MTEISVKAYLDRLREALPYVPAISTKEIKALHKTGDLGAVVKLIRATMNVGVRLTLHWTSGPAPSHIPNAPAWISLPPKMPYYGTPAFNEMKLDMFLLKQFARRLPYDQFAIMDAHELSHVVLDSIGHPLRRDEKAVDLTAMLLGFSRLYFVASEKVTGQKRTTLGYLTSGERLSAAYILEPRWLKLYAAKAITIALLVFGFFPGVGGVIELHNLWMLHEKLLAQAAAIRRHVPQVMGSSTVLTDAGVGLLSMKRIYLVTTSRAHSDRSALKSRLRGFTCAENGQNVRDGATYVYEYRNAAGQILDSITINSCPRY